MYKCSTCGYVFQNKSREKEIRKETIRKKFVYHKQTYDQLATEYGISMKTVQRVIKDKTILSETKKK
jgi:transposase-like protein